MKRVLLLRAIVGSFGFLSLPLLAQIHGAGSSLTGPHNAPQPAMKDASITATSAMKAYTVHEGDTIDVLFRFTPEFNDEVVVGPDGHVSLKSTGDIAVAGLTLPELERKVTLDSSAKLVSPEVTISLKDFDRPHVTVAGEVNTPGRQDLRKPTTVLQAIMAAGGPKEIAAMGRVVLFRRINAETSEVHILKLSKYDPVTRAKNDMVLQPDDAILVTHDHLEGLGRVIKTINLGVYLQPLNNVAVF
ncbi:MAG: polysaccharide biosynthesis/export family protein [Acidobacteriaceae bacterium]|nr:polysaccharide biosynthesis/export family protein [Acidobacteriaceae bacterium]